MADETGGVWRGLDGVGFVYITSGGVDIRLRFAERFEARFRGLSATQIVEQMLPGFPLLKPGQVWRFMTGPEAAVYENARLDEGAAA